MTCLLSDAGVADVAGCGTHNDYIITFLIVTV